MTEQPRRLHNDGEPFACLCGTIVRNLPGDTPLGRMQDVDDGEWHSCTAGPDRAGQWLGGEWVCDQEKLARDCAEMGITVTYPTD